MWPKIILSQFNIFLSKIINLTYSSNIVWELLVRFIDQISLTWFFNIWHDNHLPIISYTKDVLTDVTFCLPKHLQFWNTPFCHIMKNNVISMYTFLFVEHFQPTTDGVIATTTIVWYNKDWFSSYEFVHTEDFVYVGDDTMCHIMGTGSVQINTHDGMTRTLIGVKHIPTMARNFILLSTLDCEGYKV
jgi:hypothetical protein